MSILLFSDVCNAILVDENLTALQQTEILISALKIIDAEKYLEKATSNFVAGIDCLLKAHPQPNMKLNIVRFFRKHFIQPERGDSTENNNQFLFGIGFIIKTGDEELLMKIAVDLLCFRRISFLKILCGNGRIDTSFVFFSISFFFSFIFSVLRQRICCNHFRNYIQEWVDWIFLSEWFW